MIKRALQRSLCTAEIHKAVCHIAEQGLFSVETLGPLVYK